MPGLRGAAVFGVASVATGEGRGSGGGATRFRRLPEPRHHLPMGDSGGIRGRKKGRWIALAKFVAAYLPAPGSEICADEMLGDDRRAAVFQTLLYTGQIEARGLYRGQPGLTPLPSQSYAFENVHPGRLEAPDWNWWTDVQVRFVAVTARPSRASPGKKSSSIWELIDDEAHQWLDVHGVPKAYGQQAVFERHLTDLLEKRGAKAGEATVRRHAKQIIAAHPARSRKGP
jgi:hypothetical protein